MPGSNVDDDDDDDDDDDGEEAHVRHESRSFRFPDSASADHSTSDARRSDCDCAIG